MTETSDREKPSNAAIYARTSSPNQRQNYSIDEQISQCWNYCDRRGWIVKYVFVDACQSGKSVERPKFQFMLEKARARKFNVIVFWKLDRFCRSLVDLINTERTLREYAVELCSVTEFIDTTSSVGRFNYRNLASVAELERELIGERARLGLYALAREHKWPNPHPPLGYDKTPDGVLAVNEKEAYLVRQIFKLYALEKSMPQVAFKLNKEGIHTKKTRKWSAGAVRDILTNAIYTGKYRVAGVDSHVEQYRIVDDDIFEKADATMFRYKISKSSRPSMQRDRRMATIEHVFSKYHEFLQELELDIPS